MTSIIDMTQNILSQNIICFETRTINKEQINVPLDDASFGILDFTAVTAKETDETLEFIFVVDCSGSMSDRCSDGRTKMQHITHTLKNMLSFFNEHSNIKLYITVNTFDTEIYQIIERTNITNENISELLAKIDNIKPRGSTDIEYALIESAKKINEISSLYPTHTINHIFMTDGEATAGSNDIGQLQTYIIPNVSNIFIGFGIDHDASLLNGISSVGKSSYYFIDKLESAGLVYGEILHSIVYKLVTNPEIIIKNGLIYDYKTNTWVDTLKICDIVSESNKIFNIASNNPQECVIEINGAYISDLGIIFRSVRIENADLTTHLYRQRTLQLLYEVNEFSKKTRNNVDSHPISLFRMTHIRGETNEEKSNIKTKLHNFIDEIKKYMTENQLENDKILKNLCDDIYICYRTLGTKYGNMFSTARQTSQGTQRIYTVSNTDDLEERQHLTLRMPQRHYNTALQNFNIDNTDNLPDLFHEVSHFADAPYLTPQSTQVIRSISDSNQEFDEDNDSFPTVRII
jgi:uncharacterized protein YegL